MASHWYGDGTCGDHLVFSVESFEWFVVELRLAEAGSLSLLFLAFLIEGPRPFWNIFQR
jgi:hypothetical protein